MPKMLSLRDYRLASTTGHIVLFEGGKARDVPAAIVQEAMAAGCVLTDEKDAPIHDDNSKVNFEFGGDARRSAIYLAIQGIVETNDAKQFDAAGEPKDSVVSDMLGMTVSRKEVTTIYREYTTAKAEGTDVALHPQAQNILLVINAQSKQEVVDLAKEFDIDVGDTKHKHAKDIRKMLLDKLSGVSA